MRVSPLIVATVETFIRQTAAVGLVGEIVHGPRHLRVASYKMFTSVF